MKRLKEYFSNKTGEQIFSLCLLVGIVALMLFCAIIRLCGGLWFTADMSKVPEPSKFWQEVITAALLVFELLFVYKILCRTSWIICFGIGLGEAALGILIGYLTNGNTLITNIFYVACYLIIPVLFVKHWFVYVEVVCIYLLSFLYALCFLTGRIGSVDLSTSAYNFIYNVLGCIDFKLFFVALYLFVKYFGGIRLWKSQKRLIFQTDLTTNK